MRRCPRRVMAVVLAAAAAAYEAPAFVASGFSRTVVAEAPAASGFVVPGVSRTFAFRPTAKGVEPQAVTFAARDGVMVNGALFLPERQPAPGVVLLHMATRDRHDWDATAQELAKAGVAALAVDFRRGGTAIGGTDPDDPGTFTDLTNDADAARAYLAARPEIVATRIGMAGASLGANIAALASANDPSVRSLVLLSASLEYRGLKIEQAMTRYGGRPALIVASLEDPYALRSARTLVAAGDGQRELRVLSEAGHGTVMLGRHPELIDAVVDWFLRTLL